MLMCVSGTHPSLSPSTMGCGNQFKGEQGTLHLDFQRADLFWRSRGSWDYGEAQPYWEDPAPNCAEMNEPLEASPAPPAPSLMPPGHTSPFLVTATGPLPEVPSQVPSVGFQGILASLPGSPVALS